jgi:type IV pilus assembly protein PilY1
MKTFRKPSRFNRILAMSLAFFVGLGPVATPAYAALTALADEPINVKNSSKPNIVMTIDDSTSMLFDFLPDYVIDKYCRDGTGSMNSICGVGGSSGDFSTFGFGKDITPGYIFQQYNYPFTTFSDKDATVAPGPVSYDVAGPGSGCDTSLPKCSPGVDTGASPGIPLYPASALYSDQTNSDINSNAPYSAYGYWKLWPAPAHNNALNHMYYNPMLTYEPPAHADGTSFDSMNAANTSNWTQVPVDPWASTVRKVDLTANVKVGQWCNSDWNVGFENDPLHCRTNGAGATAADSATASVDGEYAYPWVPAGINPFYNLGYASDNNNAAPSKYTIGMSIAFTKVDPSTKALSAAWTGAQDSKYFYENDNVLWCDTTAANWPQTGPTVPQACNGYSSTSQTCNGATTTAQTCGGGNAQTCGGGTAQTCNGYQTQTCVNITQPQTCASSQTQSCANITAQTCNGSQTQTCNNIQSQSCNGFQTQSCNTSAQVCNNVKTQTCDNITSSTVCVDPPPGSCTTAFDPPGCNTCVGPECGTCSLKTTCPPPTCTTTTAGKCTISGATCTAANAAAVCTTIPGSCNLTGTSCLSSATCAAAGHCSINTGTVCTSVAQCADINGSCSRTGVACQPANAAAQCPSVGKCSVQTGVTCTTNANCPTINGTCSKTGAACTAANASTNCPATGNCSVKTTIACTAANAATQCPTLNGTCTLTGAACTAANQATNCPTQGNCSVNTGVRCTAANQATNCPAINGKCSIQTGVSCTTANAATVCLPQNMKCSITNAACTAANAATTCPTQNMTCSSTGVACTAANAATKCTPVVVSGTCSSSGAVCTTANAGTVCTPVVVNGTCSITNAACSPTNACQPAPTAGSTAVCSDKLQDASKSLREDADSAGTVCRHNNKAYADGTTASNFNYPNAKYNTPVTAGTGANACTATPRFKSVPRHYWKTNVEWCDKAQGINGDKWHGYGDSTGSCQSFKDSTHTFPRFYQFGAGPADAAYTDNVANPAFARVDLVSTNTYSHTYKSVDWQNAGGPKVTGTETVDRTYAEEMENYANWFAYYRTRIQAVKTVVSLSFLGKDPTTSKFNVDDKFRVGLHTLSNDPTTTFVPVDDFKAAQKTSWATQLFGLSIRMSQDTPNLNAIARIGEYYKNGSSTDLSATVDPIVLSCQKNWHMLFTDGLTYQQTLPAFTPGKDMDDTTPTNAEAPWLAGILAQGVDWPAPYREDPANKIVNSAADYATYYWVNDLRTSGAISTNNVGVSAADKANWQHVNFAAISLGTEGKLAAGDQSGVESQLASGALQWTVPYPSVIKPDASGVDDLWHASVNSRGRFVNADSADEIKVGMGAILADIANTAGSRAGAALQSVNLTGTTANAYRVTFEPGWGGTVSKVVIDNKTLNEIPPAPWQVGGGKDVTAPSDRLYAQLTPSLAKPEPWYTNRNIVTMHTNGTAIPFLFDSLSAAQQDTLAPGKPDRGLQVLEYIRGSAQNEGATTLSFRKRISPLGDIVNASPKFVGPANLPYQEFADPGYTAFRDTTKSRLSMVYAAANDGMLHAFADTDGTEKFAYIPRVLFRNSENAGLAALTLKEAALPPFQHHFYVDSSPKVVDVDFGSENWHSILVGGLGKGGHAYYALDVTDPDGVLTEADAATRVLWEFADADLGYTYGPAIVTKTAGWSGKWVVIVPSGYNNASGVGKIWILDAKTGTVLKTMTTGFGDSGNPAGLAQIAAFTQDYHNYKADEVYGGDQYGNLWRFDMRDPDPSLWTVGLFAKLTDPSGNAQPVTTAPQIEVDIVNGADRWVFVGTGRLLDESDLSDDQIQSFYAFRDGTQKIPSKIVSGSPIIRSDLAPVTDGKGTAGITAHGWVHDLAEHSRIVSPYQAVLSVLVYSATKPQTDPCLTGQSADIFIRNFAQGVSQTDDSFSSTGVNCTADSCSSIGGAVDAQIVGSTPDGSTSPDLYVAITLGTTGQLAKIPVKKQSYDYSHRLSWRILSE